MNETCSTCQPAWGLQRLNLQACWQQGLSGAGVRIGHLDTGVDGAHPALRGRLEAYLEFDREGYPAPEVPPVDLDGHGTHIAGILCGGECGGQQIGAAPDARLCSARVIEGGKCLARVLAGLDWLLDCGVRVACISLGLPGYNPLYEILLERMKRAGILVVAPVGNRGPGFSCSPANYPGVLAVGAVNAQDRVAHFSGSQASGGKPDLVAPGVDIPSAKPGGGLQERSGTSMAVAHVAGAAALLFEARPEATADEVEQVILSTCLPLAGYGERRCGRGLIQPLAALDALLDPRRQHGSLS